MKFRYLREGILNKMGKAAKVAGGMAAAGGALQAGKMAHNAIKPKEVSEYDDYDCDEGLGRSVLKTVAKTKKFVKSASPNAKEFAANALQGGALIGGGAAIGGHISRKANESDYDCDEGLGSSAAVAGAGLLGGCALARLGGRSAEKKIKRPKSVSEYDDRNCDEGVIGKTVKYGLAAGAALGAGKMAHDAIKSKNVSEYDDYDCDEGIGGTILKTVARGKNLAKDYIGTAKGALSKTATKTKNLAKDYVGTAKGALKNASKSTAAKVAAGTAAGAAAGAVAGSKLAGKKNESLAAAMNGGRIPRRARSVSVQESYRRIRESKNDFVEYYAEQIEKVVNIRNLEKFIEREWNDWKEKSTSRKKNFYAWVSLPFKRAFDKSLQDQGIDDWDFWQKGDGKFYNTGDKLHTLTRNVLQYWEKKYNTYLHTDEPNVRGA